MSDSNQVFHVFKDRPKDQESVHVWIPKNEKDAGSGNWSLASYQRGSKSWILFIPSQRQARSVAARKFPRWRRFEPYEDERTQESLAMLNTCGCPLRHCDAQASDFGTPDNPDISWVWDCHACGKTGVDGKITGE